MKIPEDRKPFEVTINGVKKTYEAGATVADDAAVKEIIDNGDLFPPEAPAVDTPFPIPEQSGGTEIVANPTLAGDEDSLTGIQIGDTKYAVGGGGGGGGAFIVNLSTQDAQNYTADKTAGEIYEASQTMPVLFICNLSQYGIVISLPLNMVNYDNGGDKHYDFGGGFAGMASGIVQVNSFMLTASSADAYPTGTLEVAMITPDE